MSTRPAFHILTLFLLLLIALQCKTQSVAPIDGKIKLSEGWKPIVYLIQPRNFLELASSYSGIVADSAVIASDGSFSFSQLPGNTLKSIFELCVQRDSSRFQNQLLDDNPLNSNYMPLVLENNKTVEIAAECGRFQASFSIEHPSAENKMLLQLRDICHNAYQKNLPDLNKQPDENTLLEHEAALLRFREPLMAFADTCSRFWPAAVAIRWVSPEADYERVPEFLFRQCRQWVARTHDSEWSHQLCEAANLKKLPLRVDQNVPVFPLPMASGDTIQLHELLGKRLTILDIWASWCAPCRRENREVLAPIYQQYKKMGLQIIGYSIDSSVDAWKSAITNDRASWPQSSHLSGDLTPFMETLHITTIPANFILDGNGKVLAKNLHGDTLRNFIEGYFK